MHWKKSTFSADAGDCVEVGTDDGPAVLVRNSKHVERGYVSFDGPAMRSFVLGCAAGELDDLTS